MMSPEKKKNYRSEASYHISVLLHIASDLLITSKDGTYVDLTFGGGGHSMEILNRIGNKGKLIAFDQDPNVPFTDFLSHMDFHSDKRFCFIPSNFRFLAQHLHYLKIKEVDGIIADLGLSSAQLDRNERGFSYFSDEKLDMRMNPKQKLTADDVIHQYPEAELKRIFSEYGEIQNALSLAKNVCEYREKHRFSSCRALAEWAVRYANESKKEKFLAKLFQALRMEVNDEWNALKEMLEQVHGLLRPGGRLVIISYHSLEDRMVKNLFRYGNVEGKAKTDPITGVQQKFWKILTPKPIVPDAMELKTNPRSRSAKLRAAEKI
ncbi:MAG: 16S rRNA (cytosine(1402)-N(4))-methyltransferase RsmH [Bacteroidia bacterium]|nr:16S rRNA (cytosine(1402)-N(4))-methyltransferase RsmH [Bacteroidia bacterium]